MQFVNSRIDRIHLWQRWIGIDASMVKLDGINRGNRLAKVNGVAARLKTAKLTPNLLVEMHQGGLDVAKPSRKPQAVGTRLRRLSLGSCPDDPRLLWPCLEQEVAALHR